MSPISTHVLDTARGRPAAGVAVTLEHGATGGEPWTALASGHTGEDGRIADLGPAAQPGHLTVHFVVEQGDEHHHVPLLLSPFGYSTYRGS